VAVQREAKDKKDKDLKGNRQKEAGAGDEKKTQKSVP